MEKQQMMNPVLALVYLLMFTLGAQMAEWQVRCPGCVRIFEIKMVVIPNRR
jgi:rRNA maturation endonuclease Nob1